MFIGLPISVVKKGIRIERLLSFLNYKHNSFVFKRRKINRIKMNNLTASHILQGDLSQQSKRAVFMTVHDLGCNRK